MKRLALNIVFLLFACIPLLRAQTANEGILHVNPFTVMSVLSDFDNKDTGDYENNGEVLFRGNFNNDGITTFNQSLSGYTRFEGFLSQDIKGKTPADFKNVFFNNTNAQPAFRLYGDISIAGNADFYKGIVNSDDFGGAIFFGSEATHTNASNESHVDGMVIKEGDLDFIYPIGDGGYYRFAENSSSTDIHNSLSGHYFYENSNTLYPHSNRKNVIELIDDREYWIIEKAQSNSDVMITLSWDEHETTPEKIIAQPVEDIHIVRWDNTQNLWVDEGGVVNPDQKTVTTASRVNNYGVFTLGRVKSALPEGDIVVYNGISPNDDGLNDYFIIEGINKYPKNKVSIYNRWGVKVFETTNYNSNGNVFNGYSDAKGTISRDNGLPSGTYFYVIEYEYQPQGGTSRTIKKAGYLYLAKE